MIYISWHDNTIGGSGKLLMITTITQPLVETMMLEILQRFGNINIILMVLL